MLTAHLLATSTVGAGTPTTDRVIATAAAFVALAGVIIGGLALVRPTSRAGAGSRGAVVALVAAAIGVIVGGFVIVTADGGPGTGNGIVGGYVAVVLGLAGVVLGGSALARSRRPRQA
ncbi:DUF6223 family protein [Polymorphospora sp. NPDC051019]|uniref:DUF6223 family protein n=1 Tax=Polymorphospora sp. NPDC051019 TaxID=3155725 RepID=UPI0034491265